jgi:hypothetical protein
MEAALACGFASVTGPKKSDSSDLLIVTEIALIQNVGLLNDKPPKRTFDSQIGMSASRRHAAVAR